jgi:hypothetical protein
MKAVTITNNPTLTGRISAPFRGLGVKFNYKQSTIIGRTKSPEFIPQKAGGDLGIFNIPPQTPKGAF